MTMSTIRLGIAACLGLLAFLLPGFSGAGELTAEQKAAYVALRKDFFLVLPVPARKNGRIRREVRRYVKAVNSFIEDVDAVSPGHGAAGRYFRGRIMMKLKRWSKAREDFDTALGVLTKLEGTWPRGLPTLCGIHIYRAFTFIEEDSEKIADEMEAIPAECGKPRVHEVGSLVTNWADALADAERLDVAIRAYELIKRFQLWEEEADNPQRKIDLIKVRQQGGLQQ